MRGDQSGAHSRSPMGPKGRKTSLGGALRWTTELRSACRRAGSWERSWQPTSATEPSNTSETNQGVLVEDTACSFLRFPIIRYRTILRKQERAAGKERLSFQLEARGGQAVEAPPKQAIDEHHDRRHNERRSQQHIEAAGVAGAADGAAETRGRNNPSLKGKIFRDDAGVPRAARCGYHAGDEVRKNPWQDEVAPAIPGAEAVDLRGFLEVRGDGHGAGDDVEEDVPLRAEEHQQHGGYLDAASEAQQKKKNNREQDGGRNGSNHLHQRLCDARQAGIRTDGHADGNRPKRAENERGINSEKSERGAFQEFAIVLRAKIGQFAPRVENRKPQTDQNTCGKQIADPAAQLVLFRSGKSFRGAAGAANVSESEPVEDGLNYKPLQAEHDPSAADAHEKRALRSAGAFHPFDCKHVRPNDDGAPNELIEENDYGNHGGDTPENRARVAMARRRLKKRAKAGKAKVALAEDEHFAGHEKEPAAGDRHNVIPNKTDGGKRQGEVGERRPRG